MTKVVFDDDGLHVERDDEGNTHVRFTGGHDHGYRGSHPHHHRSHHHIAPETACLIVGVRTLGLAIIVTGVLALAYGCNSYSPSQAARPAGTTQQAAERGRLEEAVGGVRSESGITARIEQPYNAMRETK
ncbi:TPA: hypothetical protein HA231_03955 [Candidatus Woesearchaeota archaeon]|nr:hypothetical protein [Candidatus Woesearchaeota archaeon]